MTQTKKTQFGLHLHNEDRRLGAPIDIREVLHDEMPLGDEPVVEAEELEEMEARLIGTH